MYFAIFTDNLIPKNYFQSHVLFEYMLFDKSDSLRTELSGSHLKRLQSHKQATLIGVVGYF